MDLAREDMMAAVTDGVREALVDLGSTGNRERYPQGLLHDAIRSGVADAIFRIATTASDVPAATFYDKLRDGVAAGVSRFAITPHD